MYLAEPLSTAAREVVNEYQQPILVNELQELEFRNGLRQKVLRREITASELACALRIFEDDVIEGKVQPKAVVWRQVYREAERLSRRLSLQQICRSFDLLHVAVAVLSDVKRFATFDVPQAKLARAAGLRPVEFPGSQ